MVNAVKVVRKGKVGSAMVASAMQEKEVSQVSASKVVKQAVAKSAKASTPKKVSSKAQAVAKEAANANASVFFKFTQADVKKAHNALLTLDEASIALIATMASQLGGKATLRLVKTIHEGKEPNFKSIAKGRE